jgi:predicted TIM-barrel fold metal-dependent hydrolase
MFIDIHVHTNAQAGPLRIGKMNFATPAYLLKRYDLLGIEKAVILPTTNPECAHQIQSCEEALAIAQAYPQRFIPFCNIDPRMDTNDARANLSFLVGYYRSQGCRGCGEVCANLPWDDPRVDNLLRACEEHRMPLTFHLATRIGGCYGLFDEPGLPLLERALAKFPGLIFLGHSQPFWAEISLLEKPEDRDGYPKGPVRPGRVVELMRRYPNLHGDLSAGSGYNAVSRDEGFGAEFLEEFQDRLYFGTDICHPDTETPLVDYLLRLRAEGKISGTCFQKVARENALRLLAGP